jgi:hypothetical protein
MIAKRILGLLVILALLAGAVQAAAAEKTFELTIPGCTA